MTPAPAQVRLLDLVEHTHQLDAETPLTAVQAELARRQLRFLGVTAKGAFAGVASGREITELLSRQFGNAVFGRKPVGEHVMKDPLVVTPEAPLTDLLKAISGRSEQDFYDDVALVTAQREFLGLIPVHRLVRLQTSLLLANLTEVEGQRRELAVRNRRMEEDLRMAREVQLALLPAKPTRVAWSGRVVETQHVYEATELIGGDYFAVFSPAEGMLACCICDVVGHGVRPALITAILRALIEESHAAASDPGAMLTHLNRSLQTVLHSAGAEIFVTAGYAVVDLVRAELRYAQAGHPRPLLRRDGSRTAAELELAPESAGPALGLLDDASYAATVVPFGPGDALLLYTDGVIEVLTPEGVEFGVERLQAAFGEALEQGRADLAPALVEAARRFTGVTSFPDDVCILAIRCAAEGQAGT